MALLTHPLSIQEAEEEQLESSLLHRVLRTCLNNLAPAPPTAGASIKYFEIFMYAYFPNPNLYSSPLTRSQTPEFHRGSRGEAVNTAGPAGPTSGVGTKATAGPCSSSISKFLIGNQSLLLSRKTNTICGKKNEKIKQETITTCHCLGTSQAGTALKNMYKGTLIQ